MSDVLCRIVNKIGRITLNRSDALNALSHDMCLEIEAALDLWRDTVTLVIIDAEGDKAFCAGGDIADLYDSAKRGDIAYGRRFWRDEYRLNTKLSEYPVPIVSFLQGFVMGGGVGLGCHVSHRVVCETTKIAMPECSIGLVPDVGGSLIMANAPGALGEYLGLTGARMSGADAIFAGFADIFVAYEDWTVLKDHLIETGDIGVLSAFVTPPPESKMAQDLADCDRYFAQGSVQDIHNSLCDADSDFASRALKGFMRGAPLALACCHEVLSRLKGTTSLRDALALEYRFSARAVQQGDFPEGIRAAIIDKDNAASWAHSSVGEVTQAEVAAMLSDLGADALNLEDRI